MQDKRPDVKETVTLGMKPSTFDASSPKKLAQRRGDSVAGNMSKAPVKAKRVKRPK